MTQGGSRSRRRHGARPAPRNPRWVTPERRKWVTKWAPPKKSIHGALGARRGITLNTVQSTLKRLFEKNLLERDKVSHAHVYRPRVSREEFQHSALGELVGELMRGEAEAMVSAFVELTERAGPEHLARLEALVAERRARAKGTP